MARWRTLLALLAWHFASRRRSSAGGMEPLLADVNMAGSRSDKLAKGCVEDMLEYGAFGLMVDHPPMPEGVTASGSNRLTERMGLRPMIRYYEIESIIAGAMPDQQPAPACASGPRKARTSARTSSTARPRIVTACWIWVPLRATLGNRGPIAGGVSHQREGRDRTWAEALSAHGQPPARPYPFKIFGALEEPPARPNIALPDRSDYRHGLHFTGLPTLFLAGVTLEKGGRSTSAAAGEITAPDPNAKAQYIEFSGQACGKRARHCGRSNSAWRSLARECWPMKARRPRRWAGTRSSGLAKIPSLPNSDRGQRCPHLGARTVPRLDADHGRGAV